MSKLLLNVLLRWGVNSLGLWGAAVLFDTVSSSGRLLTTVLVGGLILAILNAIIRPILVVLSLPVIVVSLGLFTIVINAFMLVIVSWLYDPLNISSFGGAIITGLVIGLLNFIVSKLIETQGK